MKKLFILSFIGMIAPLATFAADITNVKFENGDTTISCEGKARVDAELRIIVDEDEVVEYVQTDLISDGLAPVDHRVGGNLGLQEGTHFVDVDLRCPPNTGTYDLDVQTAGIFGGIRAINGNDSVNGEESFDDAVRVVSDSSSDTGTGGTDTTLSTLSVKIAELENLFNTLLDKVTSLFEKEEPTKSAACSAYDNARVGTQRNTYNNANVKLQGFLLSQGASIPALEQGAAFGYMGSQTLAAEQYFLSIHPECR